MARSTANILDIVVGIGMLMVPILLALTVFPMLLLQTTSIAGIFASADNVIYSIDNAGEGHTQAQASDPMVDRAVDTALRDPVVSSILSSVEWELRAATPVLDYNGLSLVFSLAEPVFVSHDFKQWHNPLGSTTIMGWTTQLIVDVNLDEGKVMAIIPSEPDHGKVPPTRELASRLGSLGSKVLEGAKILEEYEVFKDVEDVEARAFWITSYGPVKKAYYHIINGEKELVGVGCIDLNLMMVDKSCTGKIVNINPGAMAPAEDEAKLAREKIMHDTGSQSGHSAGTP